MRAVTTATAAVAIGVGRKTLENLLCRLGDDVIPKGRQGVERRIPVALLMELMIATELSARLGAPVREAFVMAQRLVRGESTLGPFLQIRADLALVRAELDQHLETAIEAIVRRPRGRPPRA